MDNPCDLATEYAVKIENARDMEELSSIAQEIKARLGDLKGWEDWLRGCWKNAYKRISESNTPIENFLSTEGKKWLKSNAKI